jgi:hypothetical protein
VSEEPDEANRIEGQVAQILTSQQLVINRGESDGVEVGMRFAILTPKGADVKDPNTGEILGSIEVAKTFVKIIGAKDRLSVGRTFRKTMTPGGVIHQQLNPFPGLFDVPTEELVTRHAAQTHADPHLAQAQPDEHAALADDDHAHAEPRLGPIDWPVWGYAILGALIALLVLALFWVASS